MPAQNRAQRLPALAGDFRQIRAPARTTTYPPRRELTEKGVHRVGQNSTALVLGGKLSLICSDSGNFFCKGIAPFTQALMLKTSPDRFDHWSGSACRLGLHLLEPL